MTAISGMNITEEFIVMLAIPFSLVGGVWLMYILGYNMSVAVAVGFIGLPGRSPPIAHPAAPPAILGHRWISGYLCALGANI